uniref:Uncharacterized protein n=1 Tax=Magallana gigas TaxID=29159 RepID=K1QY84_MAGGI
MLTNKAKPNLGQQGARPFDAGEALREEEGSFKPSTTSGERLIALISRIEDISLCNVPQKNIQKIKNIGSYADEIGAEEVKDTKVEERVLNDELQKIRGLKPEDSEEEEEEHPAEVEETEVEETKVEEMEVENESEESAETLEQEPEIFEKSAETEEKQSESVEE